MDHHLSRLSPELHRSNPSFFKQRLKKEIEEEEGTQIHHLEDHLLDLHLPLSSSHLVSHSISVQPIRTNRTRSNSSLCQQRCPLRLVRPRTSKKQFMSMMCMRRGWICAD